MQRLVGIENRVYMQVADFDRVFAIADEDLDRADEDKTSAVHFMRFEFSDAEANALRSGASLIAGIDHVVHHTFVRDSGALTPEISIWARFSGALKLVSVK